MGAEKKTNASLSQLEFLPTEKSQQRSRAKPPGVSGYLIDQCC